MTDISRRSLVLTSLAAAFAGVVKPAHAATRHPAHAKKETTVPLNADRMSAFLADVPFGGKVVSAEKRIGPIDPGHKKLGPKTLVTLVTKSGNRWFLTSEIGFDALLANVRIKKAKTNKLLAVLSESDSNWAGFDFTKTGSSLLSAADTIKMAEATYKIMKYAGVPFSELTPPTSVQGELLLPPAAREPAAPAGNAVFQKINIQLHL